MTDAYKYQNKIIFQERGVPICFAFDESNLIFAHFWQMFDVTVFRHKAVAIKIKKHKIWTIFFTWSGFESPVIDTAI